MEVGSLLVADTESFELMEPGEGPLDDPAGAAKAGAVGNAASGDQGSDAAFPQQVAVLVVVVAPVGEEPFGSVAGTSAYPSDAGYRVQQGDQLCDVVPVPPVRETARGVPWRSTITWCLEPGRPRSTGEGPT